MALVTIKNPDLYRAWVDYLMRRAGLDNSTAQIRTEAFFASEAARPVPLTEVR